MVIDFKDVYKTLTEYWNLGIAVTVADALVHDDQYLSPFVVRQLPVGDLLTTLYTLCALPVRLERGDLTPFTQHKKVKVVTAVDPETLTLTTYNKNLGAIETDFHGGGEFFRSSTQSFVLVPADCADLSGSDPSKVQLPTLLKLLYTAIDEGWREADALHINTVSHGQCVYRELVLNYAHGVKRSLGPLEHPGDLMVIDRTMSDTPLWGSRKKNPEGCCCEVGTTRDCGCAFGQCAKGLVY